LAGALAEYEVVGVRTNLDLLRAIAAHPAYATAELDTGFIGRHAEVLMPAVAPAMPAPAARFVWAAAALAVLSDLRAAQPVQTGDPWSPWGVADAWRVNGDGYQDISLRWGEAAASVRAHPQADGGFRLHLPTGSVHAEAVDDAAGTRLRLDGVVRRLRVVRRGAELVVILGGANHVLQYVDPLAPPRLEAAGDDRLTAPIPARVARVLVQPGDVVKKGTLLLVLEAMKMEISLVAPIDGTIAAVRHLVDEMVDEGAELISFSPP
jgi:3-methylcrotonyl-CoA carboxylase alpha subunit